MDELVSTYARILIEELLSVHALSNMARSASQAARREHMKSAADWLPKLEENVRQLRWAIERETK